MPFVTGESLNDRLIRDGALPLDQAIPYAPLDQAAPHLPAGLSAVIDRGLAADLNQRFGSAAEFEAGLRGFLGPVPRPTDPPRRIRRVPWLGPVIGAVATGGTLLLW